MESELAKPLTEKQKKKIIADYTETRNASETARKNKVSDVTVRKIVRECPTITKQLEQKSKQNNKDILSYMDEKRDVVCNIIGTYLGVLTDPDKIEKATLQQVATSLGIIIDKFTKESASQNGNEEEHNELMKAIKKISGEK